VDRVREQMERLDEWEMRARRAIRAQHQRAAESLSRVASHLESLSPLGVLARGYSVTTRSDRGELIIDARQLQVGDSITTRFAHGSSISRVEEVQAAHAETKSS
jgi:exodeoxyribonuclease VII large subunit